MSSNTIDIITLNIWRTYFPNNSKAPMTLCYDPLSLFPRTHYELCDWAHASIYMDRHNFGDYDPDSQIFSIDPNNTSEGSQDLTTADIPKLPQLECVLFLSFDNVANTEQVLEKLMSTGVAIIINDCIKLPKEWIPLEFEIGAPPGKTRTFKYNRDENARFNKLKSLTVFRKP